MLTIEGHIMNEEIETVIKAEDGVRVSVSEWSEGGAWLYLQGRGATMSAVLTRDESQQLVDGLQAILNAEVTA